MQLLNRTNNRSNQSNQSGGSFQKKATSYKTNVATVTKLLSNGYLSIRHDSLPVPFVSFEVETNAGKHYVLQVRGRMAASLGEVKVGYTVEYGGVFVFPRTIGEEWHGGFFLASNCKVTSREVDAYTEAQIRARECMLAKAAAERGTEDISSL